MVFVSHNMPQVSRICTNLSVMKNGKTLFNGTDIAKGIDSYLGNFSLFEHTITGSGEARILNVNLETSNGKKEAEGELFSLDYLDDLIIKIDFEIDKKFGNPVVNLVFFDQQLRPAGESFMINGNNSLTNQNGIISAQVILKNINLNHGVYSLTIAILEKHGGRILLRHQSIKSFKVFSPFMGWSAIQFKGIWKQMN